LRTSFKMLLFLHSVPVLLVSSAAAILLGTIVYRLVFHPLANIPGPKIAAITRIWLAYHSRKGNNHEFEPALHRKYGPVVRISPNEVMVCSEQGVRTTYSAGSLFIKAPWYQVCAAPDSRRKGVERFDLFTEMDKERYRSQRRAIGPAYSIAGMEKHEHLLNTYLAKFLAKMRSLNGDWISLSEWMHIFALDALSTFTVSKSVDYTSQGNDGENMVASDKHWGYFTVVGLFPWIVYITQRIPRFSMILMVPVSLVLGLKIPTGLPIFRFVVPNIITRLSKLESTASARMPADRPGLETSSDGPKDLLASLMQLHTSKGARFHPSWVLGIAITNFGAGHDTMAITLSSCVYQIASNLVAKERLVKELREAGIGQGTGYTETVNRIPYLLACVKEAMRMNPAIGASMPRIVPEPGVTFAGHYLPPGTTVGVNPWALHYDPTIFSSPEEFQPERWLSNGTEDDKSRIGRMDACWLGFGGRSRSCPGQYLARFFVVKALVGMFGVGGFNVEVRGEPEFKGWFSVHMNARTEVRFAVRR
ncbi:cytochrome P450, partial [Lindgomyces ingoldianus]